MSYGKTIEIFLVNGTTDIMTAELSNWNGKAIKLPRTEVATCEREDVSEPGVYFLFCKEEDGSDSVYIGESENVLERLKQHIADYQRNKEKYYWTNVVMFTGHDLNKALIRYLEHELIVLANQCQHYKILTKSSYGNTKLKESQEASMKEFIDNIKILIATLGYRIFEEAPQIEEKQEVLYCLGNGAEAKGFESSNGFTVLEGSIVSDHTVPSFKGYRTLREQLEHDGTIIDRAFKKNYEFASPSAASSVVLDRPSNGNDDWKDKDKTSLKELK